MKAIKALKNISGRASMAYLALAVAATESANAQGLQKAKGILDTIKSELLTIIPVAAVVILVCLAIGYAGRFMEKDTFVRWGIGVIIAGSASEIVAMLMK